MLTQHSTKDGTLLPSRRALVSEYGVALRTMERAISSLLTEGLLRADGRWGTYAGKGEHTVSPADPDSGPAVMRPTLVQASILGLLDTNSLEIHAPRWDEYGWLDIIATRAERSFAGAGGTTRYFSRFGAGPGRITVSRALAVLREEGVDALLVTGIFDGPAIIQEVVSALENCPIPAVYVSWDDVSGRVPHVLPRPLSCPALLSCHSLHTFLFSRLHALIALSSICRVIVQWSLRQSPSVRLSVEPGTEKRTAGLLQKLSRTLDNYSFICYASYAHYWVRIS